MPVILASDLIIYAVFFVVVLSLYAAMKDDGIMARLRAHIKSDRLAMASLFFLSLFFAIALSDSIRWRDKLLKDSGEAVKTEAGSNIYSPQALSLLDRVLAPLREKTEKTFSAPLSTHLYVKETVEIAGGETVRDYPPLKYPRTHILGTDKVGTDVLFSAMKGVRTGVVIGAGTTIIIIPFAIFFGVMAGYYGRVVDDIIQYLYTTLSSVPSVLLIVAFMLIFGRVGYQGGLVSDKYLSLKVFILNDRLFWLCVIMGITSWTDLCRIVRGETLKLRELDYVQAGRAFAVSNARIMVRHIVPNLMHLVLITMVLHFSGLVLSEAILSYIGIGVGPETGSWGNMINNARLELTREPVVWWSLFGAFVFMFVLVLSANIFGDSVRDALDPKAGPKARLKVKFGTWKIH